MSLGGLPRHGVELMGLWVPFGAGYGRVGKLQRAGDGVFCCRNEKILKKAQGFGFIGIWMRFWNNGTSDRRDDVKCRTQLLDDHKINELKGRESFTWK